MALINETGGSQYGAYAIRVSRLESDGVPIPGATNLYIPSPPPIEIKTTWNKKTGTRFEQRNGAGGICTIVQQPDETQGLALALKLCQLDAELLEILTGGTLIEKTVGGNTEVVGYKVPPLGQTSYAGVVFEWWTANYRGNSQDVAFPWTKHVCTKTTWTIADATFNEGIADIDLAAVAYENPNFEDGPLDDWNAIIDTIYAFQVDTALPSPREDFYQTLPGS